MRLSGQDRRRGTFSPSPRGAARPETASAIRAVASYRGRAAGLRGHRLGALRGGCARFRVRLLAVRAERAGHLGGAIRRFRQRRAGCHRPVHRLRRAQVAAYVRPDAAPCRMDTKARAPSILRRGSSAFCSCAPSTTCRLRTDHAVKIFHLLRRQMERDFRKPLILMTPKSLLRHKRAVSRLDGFVPRRRSTGCSGMTRQFAGREDQARSRRQDPARRALHRQGLLRSLSTTARSCVDDILSPSPRAALSVSDQGADDRVSRLRRRRSSGARKSRGIRAAGFSSIFCSNGCSTRSAPIQPRALRWPARFGFDRCRLGVDASGATQAISGRRARIILRHPELASEGRPRG